MNATLIESPVEESEPDVSAASPSALPAGTSRLRTQTLAVSVVIFLVSVAGQRVVGVVRSVLMCRWLDQSQLGEWDLAFSFVRLSVPIVVLSLPGIFRRYLEHYRRQGMGQTLLVRTALATITLALVAACILLVFQGAFARAIFGTTDRVSLIPLVAGCLLAAIAYNFSVELFTSLRCQGVASGMHLWQAIWFTVLSIGLAAWEPSARSVLWAYGIACVLCVFGGATQWRSAWSHLDTPLSDAVERPLWSTVLPFAFWMWVGGWLSNAFDLADRYLLVHLHPGGSADALRLVGNYHGARIIPLLLIMISNMLASIVVVHLSHEWEQGRHRHVGEQLNLILKLHGIVLLATGVGTLLFAPLLFEGLFQGKFGAGQAILPVALTYSCWNSLAMVAQSYLICAERLRLGSFALLGSLVFNVLLNLWMVPRFGLQGAVVSTAAANLLLLLLMFVFARGHGFRVHFGTLLVAVSPLVLNMGWPTAIAWLTLLLVAGWWSDRLLTCSERQTLRAASAALQRRLLPRVSPVPVSQV